ncbi:MAG: hypothetical protein IMY67_05050 [Bacteroidetes bacterium]|nr:hypothetical protein [Bacteroidota bacterium]
MKLRIIIFLFSKVMLLVFLGNALTACTTLTPIELSGEVGNKIKVNNKVHIQINTGEKISFSVSKVTSTKIFGDKESVLINDVKVLEEEKISPLRNSLIVGGIVGIIILNPIIGVLAFVGSYSILELVI